MTIVIASNNQKKTAEIKDVFVKENINLISQAEFDVPDIVETGLTFVENAILKARNAAKYSSLPAIGDDSGLEVKALAGKPGIYSSRFAGIGATDQENIDKLLQSLQEAPENKRHARFQCVMVFLRFAKDPVPIVCQGTWEGQITFEPQGSNGFGYDPVFWVPEYSCIAAELDPKIKNTISHRAQAIQQMAKILKQENLVT